MSLPQDDVTFQECESLLVVTGGPGVVVKQALQSGKKVIGAGAGNPPAAVDKQRKDIKRQLKISSSVPRLDNNILCIAEKSIVAMRRATASSRNGESEDASY